MLETSPGLYTKYAIVVTEKIAPVAGAPLAWIESVAGIAVVSIICIGLFILIALLFIYFFITRPRRRSDE